MKTITTVISDTDFHADDLCKRAEVYLKRGWKLAGPIQVCPVQNHGGHRYFLATLTKEVDE